MVLVDCGSDELVYAVESRGHSGVQRGWGHQTSREIMERNIQLEMFLIPCLHVKLWNSRTLAEHQSVEPLIPWIRFSHGKEIQPFLDLMQWDEFMAGASAWSQVHSAAARRCTSVAGPMNAVSSIFISGELDRSGNLPKTCWRKRKLRHLGMLSWYYSCLVGAIVSLSRTLINQPRQQFWSFNPWRTIECRARNEDIWEADLPIATRSLC